MKVETKKLKAAMKKLKPAISKDEFGEYIYWLNDKLVAYDGVVAIVVPIDDLGGQLALPSKEFEKLISKVKTTEVEFERAKGETNVKAGYIQAVFLDNQKLIEKIDIDLSIDKEMKKLPSNFIEGVELVKFSIGKEQVRPIVNTMCISGDTLTTTNNFTISQFKLTEPMEYCLIPQPAVNQLANYDLFEYATDDCFIYFKSMNGIYFIARLLDAVYFDLEDYFEVEGEEIVFPDDTLALIETSKITTSKEDNTLSIEIEDGKMVVSSSNVRGRITTETTIDTKSKLSFLIDADFFAKVLKITKKVEISKFDLYLRIGNLQHVITLTE